MKLKINGLIDNPKWQSIPCSCDMSNPEKCHPISRECKHCCCKQAEDSLPRECFDIIRPVIDKNGKDTGKTEKIRINEITIDRTDDGYQSIRGWTF
tara:strand:+ start:864 stop:1151 length:288 start_codon:yes stop_codon:yes gene_type:complete